VEKRAGRPSKKGAGLRHKTNPGGRRACRMPAKRGGKRSGTFTVLIILDGKRGRGLYTLSSNSHIKKKKKKSACFGPGKREKEGRVPERQNKKERDPPFPRSFS